MSLSDRPITGTMLRDMVVCERRVELDVHADAASRDAVSSFVAMLWAGGIAHETQVLEDLRGSVADLRDLPPEERMVATLRALASDVDHVLGGIFRMEDVEGRPDLVSRIDGRWVVGDVKSGTPFMPDGIRLKLEYGVQIALYARLLASVGAGFGDSAFIVGSDGARVVFDLSAQWGGSTMAAMTEELVTRASGIRDGSVSTRGAASATCGMCHWRSRCRAELEGFDDLTLLPELGRKARSSLTPFAATRTELAALDVSVISRPGGRTLVPGIGADRLKRFRDRALLQVGGDRAPYARRPLGLSRARLEWHFDIEADPTRNDLVYLHGVWERRLVDGEERTRFIHFFAEDVHEERAAFEETWRFLHSEPGAVIYYYSPYERTSYRRLQHRYPEVCSAQDVEDFFGSAQTIDLYTDVLRPHTEWPTSSYGIKAIAKLQGFAWAAEDASGASSIAWFDEYARTRDPDLRERIIDYNRSDCIASAVVLDALLALPVR